MAVGRFLNILHHTLWAFVRSLNHDLVLVSVINCLRCDCGAKILIFNLLTAVDLVIESFKASYHGAKLWAVIFSLRDFWRDYIFNETLLFFSLRIQNRKLIGITSNFDVFYAINKMDFFTTQWKDVAINFVPMHTDQIKKKQQ